MPFRTRVGLSIFVMILILAACGRSESPAPAEPPVQNTASPETSETAPELRFRLATEDGNRVESVTFSPDGTIVAGGSFLEAHLWNATDGQLVRTIEQGHTAEDLAFSPDGTLLAAGLSTGGVQVSLIADGSELPRLHTGFNNRVAFSPDGQTLATGNRTGLVWIWHLETGEQLAELASPIDKWITALAFSPDGEILAAGHSDGTVHLWRVSDSTLLHALKSETAFCRADSLAFSPDGQTLAVAGARDGQEQAVALWSASSDGFDGGSVNRQTLGIPKESKAVAFSPDGRWLAAGSAEGVRLWEMPEGALRVTLDHVAEAEETDWVTDMAFSPDGTLLAFGRWTGSLEIWAVGP
jgi:WD40 repeat protein